MCVSACMYMYVCVGEGRCERECCKNLLVCMFSYVRIVLSEHKRFVNIVIATVYYVCVCVCVCVCSVQLRFVCFTWLIKLL